MPRQAARHTLYDVLDQKGYFDSNPANPSSLGSDGSSIYQKQEFPRLVYHPEGKRRQTVPAEVVLTPFGPKEYGQQTEVIHQEVKNAGELRRALADGWHLLPAEAMRAGGEDAPATTEEAQQIQDMSVSLADMQAELVALRAKLAQRDEEPTPTGLFAPQFSANGLPLG